MFYFSVYVIYLSIKNENKIIVVIITQMLFLINATFLSQTHKIYVDETIVTDF